MSDEGIPAFEELFSFKPKPYVTTMSGYRPKQTRRAQMMRDAKKVAKRKPEYDRDAYNRGWYADQRGASIEAGSGQPIEWDDGFSDHANMRDKWHTPLCPNHGPASSGGCGK